MVIPGGKMQDLQEGGDSITGSFTDLGFVDEGLIEQGSGVLLLFLCIATGFLSLGLLASGSARDIESHLAQLILASARLLATAPRAAQMAIGAGVISVGSGKLDGDLVPTGQVGVGNLGVGDLECGFVLDVENELGLGKLGLAPVPASQGVFLGLEVYAVPVLEDLG